MLIAIDIGNTTLQIGVFNDRRIVHTWRLATQHDRLSDEYGIFVASLLRYEGIQINQIDGAIISSVVPALARGRCRHLHHLGDSEISSSRGPA